MNPNKEKFEYQTHRFENFLYRFSYKAYSELKSLLRSRDFGVKIVILDKKKNLALLVRHQYMGKNLWYLPGGGIQAGERPDEAIKREISEELVINMDEPILTGIYKGEKRKTNITFLFSCYGGGEVKLAPTSEIEEVRFFNPDHLPENLAPGVKERVNETIRKVNEEIFNSSKIIWGKW